MAGSIAGFSLLYHWSTYYGKFILDRLLKYDTSLKAALGFGSAAFDATRTSVTDVDYPIDVAIIATGQTPHLSAL